MKIVDIIYRKLKFKQNLFLTRYWTPHKKTFIDIVLLQDYQYMCMLIVHSVDIKTSNNCKKNEIIKTTNKKSNKSSIFRIWNWIHIITCQYKNYFFREKRHMVIILHNLFPLKHSETFYRINSFSTFFALPC